MGLPFGERGRQGVAVSGKQIRGMVLQSFPETLAVQLSNQVPLSAIVSDLQHKLWGSIPLYVWNSKFLTLTSSKIKLKKIMSHWSTSSGFGKHKDLIDMVTSRCKVK